MCRIYPGPIMKIQTMEEESVMGWGFPNVRWDGNVGALRGKLIQSLTYFQPMEEARVLGWGFLNDRWGWNSRAECEKATQAQ